MRHPASVVRVAFAGLLLAITAFPVGGQVPGKVPTISARTFTSGSAKVTVKGSFQIDQDVAINTVASLSDGEMTWLQFGASGSATPNALITYQDGDFGVSVSVGKRIATAEGTNCKGKVEVSAVLLSGHYTCAGVTSYDPTTSKMGKVDINIVFTARI
jgi:hypothetical protein